MPQSIGVNLRITGHSSIGKRRYMEDFFNVAYQKSEDEKNLEYAFVGVFDGHGGNEAANFAREHLMNFIVEQKLFWSENDDDVLRAIREGYICAHYAMWREQEKWPKTSSGFLSTAGTTASVAFIRRGKLYIGHVGDSGIILGYQEKGEAFWRAQPLTQDHKPESIIEKQRIMNSGGKVMVKSGVPRVVWNRPRLGHNKGPVRRSTPIDEIPFLAVARSLGDLWSYNSALDEFVVSPDPDVQVIKIDTQKFRCLIFGTDGLWNVLTPRNSVDSVHCAEEHNQDKNCEWTNPSKYLVDSALKRWNNTKMRADNISVVTVMLYPPKPPPPALPTKQTMKTSNFYNCPDYPLSSSSLLQQQELHHSLYLQQQLQQQSLTDDDGNVTMYDHSLHEHVPILNDIINPSNSMAIMTRYDHNIDDIRNNYNNSDMITSSSSTSLSSSTNTELTNNYNNTTTTFAETYNSLLLNSNYDTNSLLYNNPQQSLQQQQQFINDTNNIIEQQEQQQQLLATTTTMMTPTEPYSLTSLQTRTEQLSSFIVPLTTTTSSSTPSSLYNPNDYCNNSLEIRFNDETNQSTYNNYNNETNYELYNKVENNCGGTDAGDSNDDDDVNNTINKTTLSDNINLSLTFNNENENDMINVDETIIKVDDNQLETTIEMLNEENENNIFMSSLDETIQINEISSSDSNNTASTSSSLLLSSPSNLIHLEIEPLPQLNNLIKTEENKRNLRTNNNNNSNVNINNDCRQMKRRHRRPSPSSKRTIQINQIMTRSKDNNKNKNHRQINKILRIAKKDIKKSEKHLKAKIKLFNVINNSYKKKSSTTTTTKIINEKENNNLTITNQEKSHNNILSSQQCGVRPTTTETTNINLLLNTKRTLRSKNIPNISTTTTNQLISSNNNNVQRKKLNKTTKTTTTSILSSLKEKQTKSLTVQMFTDLASKSSSSSSHKHQPLRQSCRLNDKNYNKNDLIKKTHEATSWINTLKKSSSSSVVAASNSSSSIIEEISSSSASSSLISSSISLRSGSRKKHRTDNINKLSNTTTNIIKTITKRISSRNNLWCSNKLGTPRTLTRKRVPTKTKAKSLNH